MKENLETPKWVQLIQQVIEETETTKKKGYSNLNIESMVYRRIVKLGKRTGDKIISFPKLREKICPVFCLKKDELKVIIKRLENMDLIKIVNKRGIEIIN